MPIIFTVFGPVSISALLLHSQLDSLKCRSDGLLKCHGSDTDVHDFAICQVVQLLPPPQSSPSREASRNFIASSQSQNSRGSRFLITGLPSFEYQTGGMSCWFVWRWGTPMKMRGIGGRGIGGMDSCWFFLWRLLSVFYHIKGVKIWLHVRFNPQAFLFGYNLFLLPQS